MIGPIVLDSASSFVIGGVGVLTVVIAVDMLAVGESGTGFLQAATGVGGVVAGVAGGALLARRLQVPLLAGGIAGGIGLVGLALSDGLAWAMIAIAVAVGGLLLLDVVNTTLIQRMVPDELRGRAMGILQTSSAIVYSLGSLLMPILGALLGVPAILVIAAAAVGAGVAGSLVLIELGPPARPVDPVRLRLLDQPIFAGLPPARLEAAARALAPVAVEEGQAVVREGDPADRFYLVDSGRLRVTQTTDGAEVELRELGPGAVFGEIGLLRDVPRTATVTATSPGVLYALDAAGFAELVGSGPGLGSRLLDLYRGALGR
jgi:MFS family permease